MKVSEGHAGKSFLSAMILGLVLSGTVRAQFAGGTGEPNDPYQIATVAQLLSIGSAPELPSKHYVLTRSVNLSGTTYASAPLALFSGTLDGKGHTISNLRIRTAQRAALIGHVDREAEVRNLGVIKMDLSGAIGGGGLAGMNNGAIVDCYSTGTIVGSSGTGTGGLVGTNIGTLLNSYSGATVDGGRAGGLVGSNFGQVVWCYATGDVTGVSDLGGLAGANSGTITSSYALGTVTGWYSDIGGLVGLNFGRITDCYAKATVTGQDNFVGGLVGENRGGIASSYVSGDVTGVEFVGGLVGHNDGSVASCYTSGSVAGIERIGGLIGYNGGHVTASYSVATVGGYGWHVGSLIGYSTAQSPINHSYFLEPEDAWGLDNTIGTALTDEQMRQQGSFVGFDFWSTAADGTSDIWFMPPQAYPVLAWQSDVTGLQQVPDVSGLALEEALSLLETAGFAVGQVTYDFDRTLPAGNVIHSDPHGLAPAGSAIDLVVCSDETYDWATNAGDGSAANPYQIRTAGELEALGDHPELWSRHFVLVADLDLAGRAYEMALIAPDTKTTDDFLGTAFTGTFDGQDHVIANLTIRRVKIQHNYVGLFGLIDRRGRVENLHLEGADVEGGSGTSSYVGVLAGYSLGTVTNCSATGHIRNGRGDGLVGFNGGTLTDCYADIGRI